MEVQCDGMNRDGPNGLLFFLNTAQNLLLNAPVEQNIKFDSTGRLPVLNTTKGVYEYTAPDDCWRIAGILIETNRLSFIAGYSDYGYSVSTNIRLERMSIAGINYIRWPYVRSYDSPDSGNASIKFTENPGDTTDIYRWYYYVKPTKIYSDEIALSIKSPFDYLYLFPAVVRLVQGFKDGDYLKAHSDVLLMRKNFMKEMNKGEQGFDYDGVDRGF